eukprot:774958-Rhodomonas_salina.2
MWVWTEQGCMPPPTAAELAHRQAVARAKHIQMGTQVSQTFLVTYTERGAQRQCSKHHVLFAGTLGFTEHGHTRVQWERSEFDGNVIADPFGIAPVLELQRCHQYPITITTDHQCKGLEKILGNRQHGHSAGLSPCRAPSCVWGKLLEVRLARTEPPTESAGSTSQTLTSRALPGSRAHLHIT